MKTSYGDFLGRGWSFPVRVENGQVATVSDFLDIREAIQIILGTAVGERIMRPEFGSRLSELVFAPNNGSTLGLARDYAKTALDRWEPRIRVDEVTAVFVEQDYNRMDIDVHYTVRTSNTPDNLVYPFYLGQTP